MLRHRTRTACSVVGCTLVLMASGAARADPLGFSFSGIRLWPFASAIVVTLELPVMIVEALVYWFALRIPARQAALTSLVANLVSLVFGAILLLWGTPASVLVGMALMLVVEVPLVRILNPAYADRRRLVTTAVVVNLVTYTALAALISA